MTTFSDVIQQVLLLRKERYMAGDFGPFVLFVSRDLTPTLKSLYNSTVFESVTVKARLLEIDGIVDVKLDKKLQGYAFRLAST
jgi:hypothetical protein